MVVIARPWTEAAKVRQERTPQAVEMHRAGTALAMIAAFLRARKTNLFTQCIEQCRARIGGQGIVLAVDAKTEA